MNDRRPRLDDPRLDRVSDLRRRARALRAQARRLAKNPFDAGAAFDSRENARQLDARAERLEEAVAADAQEAGR